MDTFSFSRLNLFETCARRFYYKYILQLPDLIGLPAIFGKTVHKAVELMVAHGYSLDSAVTQAWVHEAGMSEAILRKEIEKHAKVAQTVMRTGTLVSNFNAETHFIMELAENIKLQGYIDLHGTQRDGYEAVVDWKTGRNRFGVLDSWQIPLYAAYIMESNDSDVVKGMLVFTRFNWMEQEIITRDIAEKAKEWALITARTIQTKIDFASVMTKKEVLKFAFPSRPCGACSHCPWARECLMDDNI